MIEVTSNSLSLCSSEMFESGSQPRPCALFSLVRCSPPVQMLLSYWPSLSQVSRLPCTIPTLFPQRCFQEERNNQCMLSVRLKCKDLCVELLEKKSESLKATTSSNRFSAYGSCTWYQLGNMHGCIVAKKRDPGILDPELFLAQIRKVEARLGKLAKIRKVETD